MSSPAQPAPLYSHLSDENALLLQVLKSTSRETGDAFFRVLVKELAAVLGSYGALVADYLPDTGTLSPRAYWLANQWVEPGSYEIAGTPCEGVIRSGALFQIPDRVIEHYPRNSFLRNHELVSYTGMPFREPGGSIIGHLAVLDSKPVPDEERYLALFEIFGNRAAAEMARLHAEQEVRDREHQLRGLVDGALDAIIEFDDQLGVRLANPSARQLFGGQRESPLPRAVWQADRVTRSIPPNE